MEGCFYVSEILLYFVALMGCTRAISGYPRVIHAYTRELALEETLYLLPTKKTIYNPQFMGGFIYGLNFIQL